MTWTTLTISNNKEYALLAEQYFKEDRRREPGEYTSSGWLRRQARLGIYSLLMNCLSDPTHFMKVTQFINSNSIGEVVRLVETFRNGHQENLATYFGWSDLSTIQRKIDLRNELLAKLFQA